ncbi:MAG TPA: aromatic-ring-hydroxylating dioxygenase subunit beta [Chloroflexota bacterium]|nr:aromatic-ring-hydroxylating dioxygenase subunit beta [Chloroflexota bacterium]
MIAVSADLRREVEDFLYQEARLLDEGRLDDWLALFVEDLRYWVPCNEDDIDPDTHVSIVYDDRLRLEARVWRLAHSGIAYAQVPPSRLRHLITNIEVEPQESGAVLARSNFLLLEVRRNRQNLYGGSQEHHLRREDDGWKIALKKVNILTNDLAIDNLTFLV